MIDFKNLPPDVEEALMDLILHMQKRVINEIDQLASSGAKIIAFEDKKNSENVPVLNFKNLDSKTETWLLFSIESLKGALLDDAISSSTRAYLIQNKKYAGDAITQEVEGLTVVGISMLKQYWDILNSIVLTKPKKKKKSFLSKLKK